MGSPQPPPSPPTSPLPAAARQGRSLSPPAASWGRSSPPAAAAARRRAPPGTATARRAPGTAPPTASSGGLRGAMQEDSEKESSAAGSAVLGCTLLSARPAHLLIPLPPPVRAHTPSCPLFFFFLINSSLVWVGLGHSRILQRAGLERRDAGMGSRSQAARGGIQLPQPYSRALGPLPPRTAQPPYPMPCVLRGGGGERSWGVCHPPPPARYFNIGPPRPVPLLPLRVPLPSCSASPHWQRGQGWAGGTRVRPLSAVPLPPYADTR